MAKPVKIQTLPPGPERRELHFSRFQFDDTRLDTGQILNFVDFTDACRMQFHRRKLSRRKIPPKWLKNKEVVYAILRSASASQRRKWLYVLLMYYVRGFTASDIADTLGTTRKGVTSLLERLNRRARTFMGIMEKADALRGLPGADIREAASGAAECAFLSGVPVGGGVASGADRRGKRHVSGFLAMRAAQGSARTNGHRPRMVTSFRLPAAASPTSVTHGELYK
jgi:hypothetical protein